MPHSIRIGDITILLSGDLDENLLIDPPYLPFLCDQAPDINLTIREGPLKNVSRDRIFDCPPIWALYRNGDKCILEIFPGMPDGDGALVFDPGFKEVELYMGNLPGGPLRSPAFELLMVNYLAQGRGMILHACGVIRDGKGLLFVGESGAGKTTMARLWAQEQGAEVLSDDRTIIRIEENEFRMYGTPWHGEGKFGSPGSAEVEKMFFIAHGNENAVRETRSIDAASRLLTCSFPPYWDAEGMAFTLEFIGELTARVSCQELSFKPDRAVVEMLKG